MANNKKNIENLLTAKIAKFINDAFSVGDPRARLKKKIKAVSYAASKADTPEKKAKLEAKLNKLYEKRQNIDDKGATTGQKVTGFLGAAAIVIAAFVKVAKAGIQSYKKSMTNTQQLAKTFKLINSEASAFGETLAKANAIASNQEATSKNTKALLDAEKVAATGFVVNAIIEGINKVKKKIVEFLEDEDYTTLLAKHIIEANKAAFMNKGYSSGQIADYSDTAINYAVQTARGYAGNKGLNADALIESDEYKEALNRANSWINGGMNSNMFQGGLAELLGNDYIPGLIMSAEVQAEYTKQLVDKLSGMSLEEQQSTMSSWENAGTILNNIAKNLYSFDEVISQDAIKVNDAKTSKILDGVIKDYDKKDDLLSDLRDDVRAIKDKTLSTDGITKLDDNSSDNRSNWDNIPDWIKEKYSKVFDDTNNSSDSSAHTGSKSLNKLLEEYGLVDVYNDPQHGYTNKHAGTGDAADQQTDAYADYLFDKYSKYSSKNSGSYYVATDLSTGAGYWVDEHGNKTSSSYGEGSQFQNNTGAHSGSNKFAVGGIGRSPVTNATLFEQGPEAVIPLDSQLGVDYLANALREAGLTGGGQSNINVNIYGADLSDERTRDQIARDIGERIQTITLREGGI